MGIPTQSSNKFDDLKEERFRNSEWNKIRFGELSTLCLTWCESISDSEHTVW